ncbi:hypothetical protein CEXT_185951 [Caerostris extrusa]|uniref:Uncharacterized protein n=1 Tax=Caerostris extrusa TaxID=172846 RepID=A0AAV4MH95_CAEEX|nr:hypothetical protein CEXT_185951 [Caerostris extrusa]
MLIPFLPPPPTHASTGQSSCVISRTPLQWANLVLDAQAIPDSQRAGGLVCELVTLFIAGSFYTMPFRRSKCFEKQRRPSEVALGQSELKIKYSEAANVTNQRTVRFALIYPERLAGIR